MIDKELLELLACPETLQPLRLADAVELEQVNALVGSGKGQNRGGKPVKDALAAALVRQDGRVLYPIRDGIPVLLMDEGIELGVGVGAQQRS